MLTRPTFTSRKPRSDDKSMRFGVFWPYSRTQIPSAHISALNPDFLDLDAHMRLARTLEEVGMDFVLIADGYASQSERGSEIGYQDPSSHAILWAVPLLMATKHMGVVSTMHTTYLHPVHLARFGAHLDFIGSGRWGWNIVTGFRDIEARLFGLEDLGTHESRYSQAEEAVRLVKRLWSNPVIDHQGDHFTVRGRMRGPVPPEMPLLVSAASSEVGRSFAVAHCDYLFAGPSDFEDGPGIVADVGEKAARAGRAEPPKVLILADIFVRDEPGAARREYDDLLGAVDEGSYRIMEKQFARVAHNGKKPGVSPYVVGTVEEVVEQIVAICELGQAEGMLFRMPLWHLAEAERLKAVFARLSETSVWSPPESRKFSW